MKILAWLKNNYFVSIILFVAAILRFYNVDFQSLWLDEIYTIKETNPDLSFTEMFDGLMVSEPHPQLYFILVHFIFKIFGYSSFVLRMFSAILGVAGVFSIYILGKEIANKKVGIIASLLLSINYFHLFYSQEARMYSLLFFTTTLSFYYLIKFIKAPSIKSAINYTVFSLLMIYSHYFGIFALCSQYSILLFFVFKPFHSIGKKFFFYVLFSGITTVLLFLPNYFIIVKATQQTSSWIQQPPLNVVTQLIKDFFGHSEIVVLFVLASFIMYFIQLFKSKSNERMSIDPEKDTTVFGSFILFTWILITILLPLIRSYTNIPVLVNRYFINILPAVVILVSIGIYSVPIKTVRFGIILVIVVFSLTDIFIVKKYYLTPCKSQFREVSNFIDKNNLKKEKVVSSLAWHYNFYLNNDKIKTAVIHQPMEDFVMEMISDSSKIAPFWYADAHERTLNLSKSSQRFMDKHFILTKALNLFSAWAHHYSLVSDNLKEVDISEFDLAHDKSGSDFKFYIDYFNFDLKTIKSKGWAYFENQDATDTEMEIVLINNHKAFTIQSMPDIRGDVAEYFHLPYNLQNCGFKLNYLTEKLSVGNYQMGIILKNTRTNKKGLAITDKVFTRN